MNENKQALTGVNAFTGMLREGMPTLITLGTGGAVEQTADRTLPARTARNEAAFAIYLSDGAAYRVRIEQIGEGEEAEVGCQVCGELVLPSQLDERGLCPGCAGEWWERLTAQEQADWCRAHHAHYPYEDKGPMSPEQLAWIAGLLESHPFRFTTTMRRNPHWYTLRQEWQDVGDEVYTQVVRMIREHGRTEWFGSYPWRMLDVHGFKYWSYYSSRVEDVIVLNRKALSERDEGSPLNK